MKNRSGYFQVAYTGTFSFVLFAGKMIKVEEVLNYREEWPGKESELFERVSWLAFWHEAPDAQLVLAELYENGIGVQADRRSAGQCYDLVIRNKTSANYSQMQMTAFDNLQLLAWCSNDPYLNYLVARCYEEGLCVPKNEKQARDLFYCAATQGSGDALCWLADYVKKETEHPDFSFIEQCTTLFENSLGNVNDFFQDKKLALDFLNELDKRKIDFKNFDDTLLLSKILAVLRELLTTKYPHHPELFYWIGYGLEKMQQDKTLQAAPHYYYQALQYATHFGMKQLAWDGLKTLADKKINLALYLLGQCYQEGVGTEINLQQAFAYYRAITQPHFGAMMKLAQAYETGVVTDKQRNVVKQDTDEAARCYFKAAEMAENEQDRLTAIAALQAMVKALGGDEYSPDTNQLAKKTIAEYFLKRSELPGYHRDFSPDSTAEAFKHFSVLVQSGEEDVFSKFSKCAMHLGGDSFTYYKNIGEVVLEYIKKKKEDKRCVEEAIALLEKCFSYKAIAAFYLAKAYEMIESYSIAFLYYANAKEIHKYDNEAKEMRCIALTKLGDYYSLFYNLISTDRNDDVAVKYYFKANTTHTSQYAISRLQHLAEGGNVLAMVKMGTLAAWRCKYQEAIEWYEKARAAGESWALLRLGICYLWGNGVEVDSDKAISFFHQALLQPQTRLSHWRVLKLVTEQLEKIEKDYPQARLALGEGYLLGRRKSPFYKNVLIDKNPAQAFTFFNKARESGTQLTHSDMAMKEIAVLANDEATSHMSIARKYLARCYENGDSVEKDVSHAIQLYSPLALKGDDEAKCALQRLLSKEEYAVLSEEIYVANLKDEAARKKYIDLRDKILPCIQKICSDFTYWEGDSFLTQVKAIHVVLNAENNKNPEEKYAAMTAILKKPSGLMGYVGTKFWKAPSLKASKVEKAINERDVQKLEKLAAKIDKVDWYKNRKKEGGIN